MTKDDEIEFCWTRLRRALSIVEEFKSGIRWSRGTAAGGMHDVSDEHLKYAEQEATYWRKRLALHGVEDA